MAITNNAVKKVFEDLEAYRDFCRFEGPHDQGRVFNEKALYNDKDPNWQDYQRFLRTKNFKKGFKARR